MNKERRNQIAEARKLLADAMGILINVRDEEDLYVENAPENMRGMERYRKAEDTVSKLEEVADNIDAQLCELDSLEEGA